MENIVLVFKSLEMCHSVIYEVFLLSHILAVCSYCHFIFMILSFLHSIMPVLQGKNVTINCEM